jgi:hypothetical protein
MATYTYEPSKCQDGGKNQMRFELGDTVVDMDGITSPLSDEEYLAILGKHGKNWRMAKFKCLEAICMKLAYEVNTSVGGLSYSLQERYPRFKAMKDDLEKEIAAISSVPRAGNPASLSPHGGTPYFYNDMQVNRRKF